MSRPPIWLYPGSQGPPWLPGGGTIPSGPPPPDPLLPWLLLGSADHVLLDETATRPSFVEPFLEQYWPEIRDLSAGPTLEEFQSRPGSVEPTDGTAPLPLELLGSSDSPTLEEFQTRPGPAEGEIELLPAGLLGSIDSPLLENPDFPPTDKWREPLIEPLPAWLLGSSDAPLADDTLTIPTQSEAQVDPTLAPLLGSSDAPTFQISQADVNAPPSSVEPLIEPLPGPLLGSIDSPLAGNVDPSTFLFPSFVQPFLEALPVELLGGADLVLPNDGSTRPEVAQAEIQPLPGPLLGSSDTPTRPAVFGIPSASEPFLELLAWPEQIAPTQSAAFNTTATPNAPPRASEPEIFPLPALLITGQEVVRPQVVPAAPVNSQPCPTQVDMAWRMPEILGDSFAPLRTGNWAPSVVVRASPMGETARAQVECME